MAINAIFPTGVTEITVNGLHQWDYGRTLRIESADLPSSVEVHFAYPGMREAIVRACESVRGVAEVVIPDTCLEQTAPITAWVFAIDGTRGKTLKTITITVIPRAQPQPPSFPEEYTDKYTELIDAVEALLVAVKNGDYNDIMAENMVHKSGDTMTGPLTVPGLNAVHGVGNPDRASVSFYTRGNFDKGNPGGGLILRQTDSGRFMAVIALNPDQDDKELHKDRHQEWYCFPTPDPGLTEQQVYYVHTTKNAVAVEHGGTGATTAAAARTNLGVEAKENCVTSTTDRTLAGQKVWGSTGTLGAVLNHGIYVFSIEGKLYDSETGETYRARCSTVVDVNYASANTRFVSCVFSEFKCRLLFKTPNVTKPEFYVDVVHEDNYETYDGIWELDVYAKPLFLYELTYG